MEPSGYNYKRCLLLPLLWVACDLSPEGHVFKGGGTLKRWSLEEESEVMEALLSEKISLGLMGLTSSHYCAAIYCKALNGTEQA